MKMDTNLQKIENPVSSILNLEIGSIIRASTCVLSSDAISASLLSPDYDIAHMIFHIFRWPRLGLIYAEFAQVFLNVNINKDWRNEFFMNWFI